MFFVHILVHRMYGTIRFDTGLFKLILKILELETRDAITNINKEIKYH